MDSDKQLPGFLANRSVADRRNGNTCASPNGTGTGKVLIERRSGNDRRAVLRQPQVVSEATDSVELQSK